MSIICGFCDLLAGLLRRVLCAQNRRRGSIDTCYRELDEQETLRSGRQPSDSTTSSDEPAAEGKPVLPLRRRLFSSFSKHPEWKKPLPSAEFYPKQVEMLLSMVSSWNFDMLLFDAATGGQCLPNLAMHLFEVYGLIPAFNLLPEKCWHLFRLIEMGYQSENPYHNAVHAADVTQAVHSFLQKSPLRELITNKIEIMGLLLAAMTHDLDHPGVSHGFLVATNNPLAIMYTEKFHGKSDKSPLPQSKEGDKKGRLLRSLLEQLAASKGRQFVKIESPAKAQAGTSSWTRNKKNKKQEKPQCSSILEHHHWRMAYSTILQSGIFEHMAEILPEIKQILKSLILATDITRQNEYLDVFQEHLKRHTLDATRADHRLLVLQMALKTADISNPGRPWEISRKWSQRVCEEFFIQGDRERILNQNITELFDRKTNTIAAIQINFFRFIAAPLYRGWNSFVSSDSSRALLKNLLHNESEWRKESLQPGYHPTTLSDIYYSEADLVDYSLGTSTNISGSVDVLLPATPALVGPSEGSRYSARFARRSSYSPIKRRNSMKDTIRRLSAPLDSFLEHRPRNQHKDSIPEDKLREELLAATQSSDEQTSSDERKKSRMAKVMCGFNKAVAILSERKRRQAYRTSRDRQLVVTDSNGSSNGKSSQESPRSRPLLFVYDAPMFCDSQLESDDEASFNEKALTKLKPYRLLQGSTSSSASQLTSSSIPISGAARLLTSQTNTPTVLSSESRFSLPVLAISEVQSSCELQSGLKPSATTETLKSGARVEAGAVRRGSAPAPIAVSDLYLLVTKIANRTKSRSYNQLLAAQQAPAQARRGSLPVEVIRKGISAIYLK